MKKWSDIDIKIDDWDEITRQVKFYEGHNPACQLTSYWKERMSPQMWKEIKKTNRLIYGWVGDGWPLESSQNWAIKHDIGDFRGVFPEYNYRDVGDAIYQANKIDSLLSYDGRLYILDFGSGYGRLAVPFIYKYQGKITYIGVDYSPISLLVASQFVHQAVDAKCRMWNESGEMSEYDFISLPTWNLEEVFDCKMNVFVTIHSFQEMTRECIDYYVDLSAICAAKNSIFYSVNLWPENEYVKSDWKLLVNEAYPINRDGSFNQKIWRIIR